MEIGVGTGRFAAALGIGKGIEPAFNMAQIALSRGVDVIKGVGENLPYPDREFDFVLICCGVRTLRPSFRPLEALYRVTLRRYEY